ncbi:MAG: ATP-dependent nuclease [Gammaproteobacteria bacterium]
MKITHAIVENYRALQYIECPLDQFSVIIGENDVGKTSFFYALEAFFVQKKLADINDWYKRGDSQTSPPPIKITLTLNHSDSEIDSPLLQESGNIQIEGIFDFDKAPKYFVILKNGERDAAPKKIMNLFSDDHVVFVPVQRNIAGQFAMTKSALFGKMIRAKIRNAIKNSDAEDSVARIEKFMREFVKEPQEKIQKFLREQLKNESIKLDFDDLHIDPVEGINLLPKLSDEKINGIPVENRGAGTQNNIIISLFRYIAESDIKEDFIFFMEEPENSLHPKAQRQLLSVIQDISEKSQVLVTTHSAVFIDRTKYENNILFTRTKNGNTIAKVFDENSPYEVREELGIKASDALLKGGGNCALLVEGKTEEDGFPVFMEMAGINEFELGVGIINMNGKNNAGRIIRLLNSYGIPCVLALDKDGEQVESDLSRVMGENGEIPNLKKIFRLSKGTIEDYYPIEIIVDIINQHLKPSCLVSKDSFTGKRVNQVIHEHDVSAYFKTALGLHGAKMMQKANMDVPKEIRDILNEVQKIASE